MIVFEVLMLLIGYGCEGIEEYVKVMSELINDFDHYQFDYCSFKQKIEVLRMDNNVSTSLAFFKSNLN
jgi:hypothetical protein